jgi:uncharacterized protein (DUF488 family)
MDVHSIGFTKKTAREFFGLLRLHGIERLLDVRLNNVSQLAGFAKRDDLEFFLGELCQAEYVHEPRLAPEESMLVAYRDKQLAWPEYQDTFLKLLRARRVEELFPPAYFRKQTVLLCSEASPEHCHRRLVLEYLQERIPGLNIVHLR